MLKSKAWRYWESRSTGECTLWTGSSTAGEVPAMENKDIPNHIPPVAGVHITASAWRNEAQAATGGVGLMLGFLARKALRRVFHHTDRILIAEFSEQLS